jgi:hypothetical protein
MKLYKLRTYQFTLAAAVILFLAVIVIYGKSLSNFPAEKDTYKTGRSYPAAKTIVKSSTNAARTDRLAQAYGLLPLSFEPNKGQTDSSVQFVSHGTGYTLFLERHEAVIELQRLDETDAELQKMAPNVRKRFEARKLYHGSPRFRRQRQAQIVRVGIAGANSDSNIRPLDQLPGKSNYFIGNDPKNWRTGISNYGRVEYEGIYRGVDLIYYGNQRQIEFDFIVAPRVNPGVISLHIQAGGRLRLAKNGNLEVETPAGTIVLRRPDIYQLQGNKRKLVHGGFVLKGRHELGFQVAEYDEKRPLIIDPVLSYSTFLGGSGSDFAGGIAVDSRGDAYIVGQATSTNFPIQNGYPSSANAHGLTFLSELNPTGTALLYSTYLGGTGGESGNAVALDPSGNVYVTGYTLSSDFPVVNGYQASLGTPNGNAFVARIDVTQSGVASLVYSSYLGGGGNAANSLGDTALGIAADESGFAYVTGQTASDASTAPFPTTSGAYQSSLGNPNGNAFLAVLNTNWSGSASLFYSTYLGGDSTGFGDYGMGVAVDSSGDAFITGETTSGGSTPFPTTSNAYQTTLNSVYGNVFITEIAIQQPGSQSLVYSTYMGGSSTVDIGDSGSAIALDSTGNVYVDGDTTSSDFPVTSGAFQTTNSPGGRAFAAKWDLTQSGTQSLVYSTYLGGTNGHEGEVANGIAVDANGNAFASGSTSSTDFPTTSGAYQTAVKNDLWNVYLTQINSTGTGLLYSTYLGGSCSSGFGDLGFGVAVDSVGNAYVDGSTCSSDFPISPSNAYQTALAGAYNAFIAKFALSPNPGITTTLSPEPNASGWNKTPVTVSFTCIPAVVPIQSCYLPMTVSTEGANQVVPGTATDTANNIGTTSATINLDMTAPVLSITSPSSGAVVNTPYVVMAGTVSDALSGVANVSCNNAPASLSGSNFSCTVPLSSASNSITVVASDLAGNWAMTSISIAVSMAAPSALQITPGNSFLLVGSTETFTAIDQTGTSRPDVSWSVSNPLIANFGSSSPNSLAGIAAGQVTLTATVGTISGQTTVTVLVGSSLSAGTVLWSATPIPGFTAQQIVQAAPTVNGPAIFSIEADSNGNYLIRAFRTSGEQMWQNFVTQTVGNGFSITTAVGDNSGGILASSGASIVDLNAQTGNPNWQYSTSGSFDPDVAVGPDGTVYSVDETPNSQNVNYLDTISGSTGALVRQIPLPTSSHWDYNIDCFQGFNSGGSFPGRFGPPMVGLDGTVSVEVESSQYSYTYPSCEGTGGGASYSESLLLLQVLPNGATRSLPLKSYSGLNSSGRQPFNQPGDVIPDGIGGVLASWTPDPSGYAGEDPPTITDIDPQGAIQSSNSFSAIQIDVGQPISDSMVLGENGHAFITDGNNVVSFSPSTLQQSWSYTSTGGYLSLIAAISGGGVAINDDQQGVIQLDSSGGASTPVASLQGAAPYEMWAPASTSLNTGLGLWTNLDATPSATLNMVVGEAEPLASSIYAEPASGPQRQRSAIATPTHLKEKLGDITVLNGNAFNCPADKVEINLGYEGYAYCVTIWVLDKTGRPINNQQFRLWETVQQGPHHNVLPPITSQGIGRFPSRYGLFHDLIALTYPTVPQIGDYSFNKQFFTLTNNLKSYSNIRINCQDLVWNKATLIDITSTPNATCQ